MRYLPEDWGLYYRTCPDCKGRYHLSGTDECHCRAFAEALSDEVANYLDKYAKDEENIPEDVTRAFADYYEATYNPRDRDQVLEAVRELIDELDNIDVDKARRDKIDSLIDDLEFGLTIDQ